MTEFSDIEVAAAYDLKGNVERYVYEWKGESKLTLIGHGYNDIDYDADKIKIGPYRLRLIENDILGGANIYIREDYLPWPIFVMWHNFKKLMKLVYTRGIITLAVWRLAEYHEATIPSIKDVYVFQRVVNVANKTKDGRYEQTR